MQNPYPAVSQMVVPTLPNISVGQQVNNTSSTKKHSSSSSSRFSQYVNTTEKRSAFEYLIESGISREEAIDALSLHETLSYADENAFEEMMTSIIVNIIRQRAPQTPLNNNCSNLSSINAGSVSGEIFNEFPDEDAVRLISEADKEIVQKNKKQRLNDLQNGVHLPICQEKEFEKSVLLWGLSADMLDSIRACAHSQNQGCSSNSLHMHHYSKEDDINSEYSTIVGCRTIKALSLLFDFCGNEEYAGCLFDLYDPDVISLRVIIIELLLLERDSIKYYKVTAYPYLLSLAHRLDQACESIFTVSLTTPLKSLRSHADITYKDWMILLKAIRSSIVSLNMVLCDSKKAFELGASKIPKDGGDTPELFRRKSLKPYYDLINSRLNFDDDGIAMIGEEKLVSDVEEVESLDDDDDSFDD